MYKNVFVQKNNMLMEGICVMLSGKKRVLTLFLVICLMFTMASPVSLANESVINTEAGDFRAILSYFNKDISDIEKIYQVTAEDYSINGVVFGEERLLRLVGEDRGSALYRAEFDDNLVIEIKNGIVDSFANFKSTKNVSSVSKNMDEMLSAIDWVYTLANFDSSYAITSSEPFDDEYMRVSIARMYGDIANHYEGANLVINRYTSEVIVYKRFNEAPSTTKSVISEDEACNKVLSELINNRVDRSDITLETTFIRTQTGIRLAYGVSIDGYNTKIFVDAVTGDIVECSATRDTAKAFSVSTVNNVAPFLDPQTQTSLATSCFSSLGYSTLSAKIGVPGENIKSEIMSYLNRSDAYGFYIACHGSPTVGINRTPIIYDQVNGSYLADDKYWYITPDEIPGNWKFVFLDSCYSAQDQTWANAFNIFNTSTNRAFLGWYYPVTGPASQEFSEKIFPEIINQSHSNNIRDAAVWAASQVEGPAGYTPIRFYGDRTYNGRV